MYNLNHLPHLGDTIEYKMRLHASNGVKLSLIFPAYTIEDGNRPKKVIYHRDTSEHGPKFHHICIKSAGVNHFMQMW